VLNKSNIALLIVSVILTGVLVYLLMRNSFSSCNPPTTTKRSVDTVKITDTVFLPPTFVRLPGRIDTVNTTDTIYNVLPFVASAETLSAKGDTLAVQYFFPANTFLFDVRYSPIKQDKILIHTKDSIFVPLKENPYIEWGIRAACVGLGFLLGGR